MLACARIGAPHNVVFGGFSPESVRERMEFSEAKALITVDGARRKGKTAPIKQQVDEEMGDLDVASRRSSSSRHTGERLRDAGRARRLVHEAMEAADAECPAEPLGRRAPAVHPLHVGLDGEAEGHPAHDRRLPDRRGLHAPSTSSTSSPRRTSTGARADVGWVTGHSYIVYGPLLNGATSVMYEGAPDYPDKDVWWDVIERYGVTIFYTAPTAIRACMKWGARVPGQARPVVAAAAGHGGRADQPQGVALVLRR